MSTPPLKPSDEVTITMSSTEWHSVLNHDCPGHLEAGKHATRQLVQRLKMHRLDHATIHRYLTTCSSCP